ncbi:MAG: quinolinate synthase NadA [Clostridium sp.]|nr:quinolinate synthase NadA [Clostridium sp.]
MTKQEEIQRLKEEKDAVILAHFYVEPEIQEAADYIGDSFKLSRIAKELPNQTIVFCGVSFMGESGKLLSPGKRILMPAPDADCPMAHMVTKEEIERAREQYPDLAVVCYVNSTAEIKSWSDVCVTSANAVQIVRNLPNRNILFIPDRNLGRFVAQQVPEKNVILVNGFCPIHEAMKAQEIEDLKRAHPKALVLAHPECNEGVLAAADYIGSTSGILAYAKESGGEEFIIGTETGVLHELKKQNPDKRFFVPATPPVCHDMKKITLDQIIHVLKTGEHGADVDGQYATRAGASLERMLMLAGR